MTLDDILHIPGNSAVFDALRKLLQDRRAVAFVGAGASAGLYPMWNRFIEQLADYAVDEGRAQRAEAEAWKADATSTPQVRVDSIKERIGAERYRAFLRKTFGPRKGPDGKGYTATHASALRLPFRGYVTTNYDPALDFARRELRPGTLADGTPTWLDEDEILRWRTGDIFTEAEECPVLWLHGHWRKSESIVLNTEEYARAYRDHDSLLFQEMFRELWVREKLVFLGFGFADPQFTAMAGDFLRALKGAKALPRHIALLGWPADKAADFPAVLKARDDYEKCYHVKPLFYPTDDSLQHTGLGVLLAALEAGAATPAPRVTPQPAPLVVPVHQTPVVQVVSHQPVQARPVVPAETDFAITDPDWVMKYIPAGRFRMGNTGQYAGHSDEKPITEVTLTKGFWLGKTPVTQTQWCSVMGKNNNPSGLKGDDRPVERVSWDEATDFCRRLTERERRAGRLPTDREYRLPTEAEWEYACRAGTSGDFNDDSSCTVPKGKDPALERLGWYAENSGNATHPVGQKRANAWGLHDMHGNVWEWCADWYGGTYSGGVVTDPTGPKSGDDRVVRGGCWRGFARFCRSAFRIRFAPGRRVGLLGFRLAAGQVR